MPPTSEALPLLDAAHALGVSASTLRRWIAEGAPVARRGRRGRGRSTLVQVAAVTAWRAPGRPHPSLAAALARGLERSAVAVADAHRELNGPHKVASAGPMVASWYLTGAALIDALREVDPQLTDIRALPEPLERLHKLSTR
jgi:hypothetical protein